MHTIPAAILRLPSYAPSWCAPPWAACPALAGALGLHPGYRAARRRSCSLFSVLSLGRAACASRGLPQLPRQRDGQHAQRRHAPKPVRSHAGVEGAGDQGEARGGSADADRTLERLRCPFQTRWHDMGEQPHAGEMQQRKGGMDNLATLHVRRIGLRKEMPLTQRLVRVCSDHERPRRARGSRRPVRPSSATCPARPCQSVRHHRYRSSWTDCGPSRRSTTHRSPAPRRPGVREDLVP